MSTFTVEVKDEGVQSLLQALLKRMGNLQPAFSALGEDMVPRIQRRFDSSTGPDGTPWKGLDPDTTVRQIVKGYGKSYFKKSGDLNKKGAAKLASRKPLIDSGYLSREFFYTASSNALQVSTPAAYAAIHQFGGQAGRGHKVKIPARPFMPVKADGSLYPEEQRLLITALEEFLTADF